MEKIKQIFKSKKATIILLAAIVILGVIFYKTSSLNNCFTIYQPTFVPQNQKAIQININDLSKPCETRAAWFADSNSEDKKWEIEERNAKSGPKIYKFDTTHMNFQEGKSGRYTFVSDRNGKPALLGFIENTFIYITNNQGETLSQSDMAAVFNSLKRQ